MTLITLIVVVTSLAGRVEVGNLNASHLSGLGLTYLRADRSAGLSRVIVDRSIAIAYFHGAHSGKTVLIALRIVASVLLRHGVTEPVLVSVSINEFFSTDIGTLHHR